MFLARLVPGEATKLYIVDGHLLPRAWGFCSYLRGACAIDTTEVRAVRAARAQLRIMQLQRIFSGENTRQGVLRVKVDHGAVA